MKSYLGPVLLYFATFLLCIAMVAVPSCSGTNCSDPKNAGSAECNVINAVVDCTNVSSLATGVAAATPIVEALISGARAADGSINWAGIETELVDVAEKYGMCVVSQIWNDYVNPPTPAPAPTPGAGSGSGSAAPLPPAQLAGGKMKLVPSDAKAAFNRIRAKVAPGKGFKVAGGTL